MIDVNIVDINEENILNYSPRCFLNSKDTGQMKKTEWVKNQMKNGLKIKLAYTKNNKKLIGYIEYIPGKHAWRAVDAKDYLFIHCLWVSPKKFRQQNLGSHLINTCIKDAKSNGFAGVAVITSSDSFMADKDVFMKNEFSIVEKSDPYSLLVKKCDNAKNPHFYDWKKQLDQLQGLHIIYSNQCPWVARFISEMKDNLLKQDITITELKTAKEAQHAPSIYSTFTFIYNGKILASHYISKRRFENIMKKEIF